MEPFSFQVIGYEVGDVRLVVDDKDFFLLHGRWYIVGAGTLSSELTCVTELSHPYHLDKITVKPQFFGRLLLGRTPIGRNSYHENADIGGIYAAQTACLTEIMGPQLAEL